jgi:hypothetical protein
MNTIGFEMSDSVQNDSETVILFRPTGPEEYVLIVASSYSKWPPRLPGQPIFYPVTNLRYAEEIARDWNVKASGIGYVLRFELRKSFADRFPVQTVGASHHTELWIPAEDLEELNANIVGPIELVATFRP